MNAKNKNLIGTDVNIDTCIAEGYLIVDTEGHAALQLDYNYNVHRYWPEYSGMSGMRLNSSESWNNLLEIYREHKKDLDSYADDLPQITATLTPGFYDFLALADSIDQYYGI